MAHEYLQLTSHQFLLLQADVTHTEYARFYVTFRRFILWLDSNCGVIFGYVYPQALGG